MGLFGGQKDSSAAKQELMDALRGEFVLQNLQELLVKLNEKCFKSCIRGFDNPIGASDHSCLERCSDRYVHAWNTVSAAYKEELTRDKTLPPTQGQ